MRLSDACTRHIATAPHHAAPPKFTMEVLSAAVLPTAAGITAQSASPAAEVVVLARGLAKIYRSGEVEVHALRDVDLEIRRGEFVVLLGASGSGKSTLLNILGGLDVPTRGEVRFADHVLTGASESELTAYRREHVGFVFQFYNLIPSLTVRENLALVTDIAKNPDASGRGHRTRRPDAPALPLPGAVVR